MSTIHSNIDDHYGGVDVCARIFEALENAGRDLEALTAEDLTPFDQFHGGGIASTRDLADFSGIRDGFTVVDVGCGIGGPARTLAAEFGCRVIGIDLTREFVRAARVLTEKLAMTAYCEFHHGSATALPLDDACAEAAWSQNMMMNVENKAAFFSEVVRILKPGGLFAFEAVLAGDGRPIHLPTFWASRPEINFLVSLDEVRKLLDDAGLERVAFEETTHQVIATSRKRNAVIKAHDPTQLTIKVIVSDDVETKMQNALSNNEEGRTITVKGVYAKR